MSPVNSQVRDIFISFNAPLEGRCNFMYLDQRRLVTTGVGNLIDTLLDAQRLVWLKPDMFEASPSEVAAAWLTVKNDHSLDPAGGGAQYKKLTTLRLAEGTIDRLVLSRLDLNGQYLQAHYPFFQGLPADAQLAALSMTWAAGAASPFPKFWAAMRQGNFMEAANQCSLKAPKGSTLVRRNLCNKLLLVNAARVQELKLDPRVLYWPKVLPPASPTAA